MTEPVTPHSLYQYIKLLESRIDNMHPIGSIYITMDDTNPAELFGGEWEQIQGRFLLGTGQPEDNTNTVYGSDLTYNGTTRFSEEVGTLGGESMHTLTPAQTAVRSHTHPDALFYIRHGKTSGTDTVVAGTNTAVTNGAYSSSWGNGYDTASYSHKPDRVTVKTAAPTTANGSVHNNMPPFLAVYMWQRVA